MRILDTLHEFDDLVHSLEITEFIEEEHTSKCRIKTRLVDASVLWIREVRVKNRLIAYSYYWLRTDHSIIIGWDNAPHHKEVNTFPHHKHVGDKVESSAQTNLKDVLNFIRDFLS